MTEFVRFPRTPHLDVLGACDIRDDKVLTPEQALDFLADEIVVEEKVDGENLGISCDGGRLRCQSRGSYVEPGGHHFRGLAAWLDPRHDLITREMGTDLVMFGEWCAVVHSVTYNALPDWLLVFDVYDRRTDRFWHVSERNLLAEAIGLRTVPMLEAGHFELAELYDLIGPSRLGAVRMEGLILRHADRPMARAKIVHPSFVQAIGEHWRSRPAARNRLSASTSLQ